MIINIRGTSGSGKSTLVRALLASALENPVPFYGILGIKKPEAYRFRLKGVKRDVLVLGPYSTPIAGGPDCFSKPILLSELIAKYQSQGHLVYERLIDAGRYSRACTLLEQWGKESVLAFLNTPLEVCIKDVENRRGVRGDTRPLDLTNALKNLTLMYKAMESIKKKVIEEDLMRVVELSRETGLETLLALLREK